MQSQPDDTSLEGIDTPIKATDAVSRLESLWQSNASVDLFISEPSAAVAVKSSWRASVLYYLFGRVPRSLRKAW